MRWRCATLKRWRWWWWCSLRINEWHMQSVYEHSQAAFVREVSISSSNRGKHKTVHILKSFVYKECVYIFFLIILVLLNFKFIFLKYIFFKFKFNNNFLLSLLLACSLHLLTYLLILHIFMYTVIRNTKIKKMEIKYIKSQTHFVVPHPPIPSS